MKKYIFLFFIAMILVSPVFSQNDVFQDSILSNTISKSRNPVNVHDTLTPFSEGMQSPDSDTNNPGVSLLCILFVFFILFLVGIMIIFFFIFTKSKPSSSFSRSGEQKDEVSKLKKQNADLKININKLKLENERLKDKISEFESKPNKTQEAGREDLREREINKDTASQNVITQPDPPEYYDFQQNGTFNRINAVHSANHNSVYEIHPEGEKGSITLLTGKMDKTLIADKDLYLVDICEIIRSNIDAKEIHVLERGEVHLENDQWKIYNKIKIEIL